MHIKNFVFFQSIKKKKGAQARMIIRDLTGRYVWDTQLEPKMAETDLIDHSSEKNEFELRQDVRIKSVDQE